MHAATKPATLGLILVLAGSAFRLDQSEDIAKLLLVAALQFVTAPVGAHMVGRAAYRAGNLVSPDTAIDELAEVWSGRLVIPPDEDGGDEGTRA
jgi:multicomponent Na+:H+ antiporter subunit G